MFYAMTEKFTQECVFVYNFVSPNVSFILQQICSPFVWHHTIIYNLFVSDSRNWYYITVQKSLKKPPHKKWEYNCPMNAIP